MFGIGGLKRSIAVIALFAVLATACEMLEGSQYQQVGNDSVIGSTASWDFASYVATYCGGDASCLVGLLTIFFGDEPGDTDSGGQAVVDTLTAQAQSGALDSVMAAVGQGDCLRVTDTPDVLVEPATSAECFVGSSISGEEVGPADDEFDGGPLDLLAGDDSVWQVYNGGTADVIDIDSSAEGSLVMVPSDFDNNGWYGTSEGPFAYQDVTGDFAAAIRLTVGAADDPAAAPGNGYNSGGFVVRDGSQPHDWVMFNIGGQTPASGFAREVKTTVNGSSVLQLESIGERTYRLLICRVGAEIRYFTGASNTTTWTMDQITHSRPDFGSELQVGIVANAWESDPRPWVEVERIHFGTPNTLAECTSSVADV